MIDHGKLLESEYLKLQDIIERNDDRALQIKGWSVTVSLAGVIAAIISDKITDHQRGLALLTASFGAVAFWIIETHWKSFQRAFFDRINAIEDAFKAGTAEDLPLFQIGRSWQTAYNHDRLHTFVHIAGHASVMLPHLLVAALALGAALIYLQH